MDVFIGADKYEGYMIVNLPIGSNTHCMTSPVLLAEESTTLVAKGLATVNVHGPFLALDRACFSGRANTSWACQEDLPVAPPATANLSPHAAQAYQLARLGRPPTPADLPAGLACPLS